MQHLKTNLEQTLLQIDAQLDSVQAYCVGEKIRPFDLKDSTGNWVMIPLLAAKAQVLTALLNLTKEHE